MTLSKSAFYPKSKIGSAMLLNPLQARELFLHALKNRYAILAVNADSPAAIGDCLESAGLCKAPIIIETSLWQLRGTSFGRGDAVLGLARYLADLSVLASSDRFAEIPVIFHTGSRFGLSQSKSGVILYVGMGNVNALPLASPFIMISAKARLIISISA